MANTCSYTARIRGKKQDVIDFLWWLVGRGPLFFRNKEIVRMPDPDSKSPFGMMQVIRNLEQGKWEAGYVGRIGHWESPVCYKENKNYMLVEIDDYCAWSFLSTGVEGADDDPVECHRSVPELCRIYDIRFELFSEETGQGFDEYFYFDGRNEDGDQNEEFDHDDVSSEMKKEWKIDRNNDICWRWIKENGERHKEIRDKDDVFFETKSRLFPHTFRKLNGNEWKFTTLTNEGTHLDDFCKNNNNSWYIPWQKYDERGFT